MTSPRDLILFLSLAGGTMLAPACALTPPAQTSGAATSDNGVALAVIGQRCTETVETDLPGVPLVEAHVQVEVRNTAPPPLVVHRDAFHLRGADGRAIPTTSWRAEEPLPIAAGQTRTFELRFMSRGGLSCTKEMQLEASAGITKGNAPVQIGAVSFVPSPA
jgi:hypothetical protein